MTKNWVKNDRILFFLKSEKIGGEQENILLLLLTLFLSGAKISVENYVGQTQIVGLLSKFFVK